MKKRKMFAPAVGLLVLLAPWGAFGGDSIPLLKVSDPQIVHFLATAKLIKSDETLLKGGRQYFVARSVRNKPPCPPHHPSCAPETLYLSLFELSDSPHHQVFSTPLTHPLHPHVQTDIPQPVYSNGPPYLQMEIQESELPPTKENPNPGTTRNIYLNYSEGFITTTHPQAGKITIPLSPIVQGARYFIMTLFREYLPILGVRLRHYKDSEVHECASGSYNCPRERECFALSAEDGTDREAVYCLPWAYSWKDVILHPTQDITKPGHWLTYEAIEEYYPPIPPGVDWQDWIFEGYLERKRKFIFNFDQGFLLPVEQTQ